ncbi:hypothetical protein MES4922_130057 [Mesorhizobium ventifaucium]|uniref:Uncharacterized protein n=1 Tax=Mesorhizobium ventifaucium TaxID=666020 RepID=A0ABM9DGE6_9HYPH|nr:hypothetical protein MES4922_130057 [Mesorhizobium ventifaucium]
MMTKRSDLGPPIAGWQKSPRPVGGRGRGLIGGTSRSRSMSAQEIMLRKPNFLPKPLFQRKKPAAPFAKPVNEAGFQSLLGRT